MLIVASAQTSPWLLVFDEIDGRTEFVLHVLEDFVEMRMSFRFSQYIYQLQKLSALG
jgi:hypothetical protein